MIGTEFTGPPNWLRVSECYRLSLEWAVGVRNGRRIGSNAIGSREREMRLPIYPRLPQ